LFFEFINAVEKLTRNHGLGIRQLIMVKGAVWGVGAAYIPPWDTNGSAVGGHMAQHNGSGTHTGIIANVDVAKNFGSSPNDNVASDGGMPLACFFPGAAQGDALINQGVVSHKCRFSNDNPHAVVDKDSFAEGCTGVNLYASKKPGQVRDKPGQEGNAMAMQPMGKPMTGDRMETGITEQDF
jgi:hypothetical protein